MKDIWLRDEQQLPQQKAPLNSRALAIGDYDKLCIILSVVFHL